VLSFSEKPQIGQFYFLKGFFPSDLVLRNQQFKDHTRCVDLNLNLVLQICKKNGGVTSLRGN
jgi:hypothetical protein